MICQWLVHAQCLVSEIEEPLLTRLARVMVIRSTVVQMSINDVTIGTASPRRGSAETAITDCNRLGRGFNATCIKIDACALSARSHPVDLPDDGHGRARRNVDLLEPRGTGIGDDLSGSVRKQELIPINILPDRAADRDDAINIAIRVGLNIGDGGWLLLRLNV
jgi:hypothetical protein